MNEPPDQFRQHLVRLLDWEEAHVSFDRAVEGIPPDRRGTRAPGFDRSSWELVEHMRIAQKDLLDFCVNEQYVHVLEWPADYWPQSPAPAGRTAWKTSIADFKADRERLKRLVRTSRVDLFAVVPTGKGRQTYVRAILLVADHTAYHVGQLVAVRRAFGVWP